MLKRILFRYIILSLPFILGILLYINKIFNIVSSLLLFVGGYILIKNLCDYRIVKRNIYNIERKYSNLDNDIDKDITKDKSNMIEIGFSKSDSMILDEFKNKEKQMNNINNSNIKKYQSYEDISGIKRVRCYKKVRRRY